MNTTRPEETSIQGLHHITAIASDPQRNIDFYAGLLGLRLVKRTVNFDDPSAYHLYYGDESGTPGSIVTFFYWPGLHGTGHVGAGQPTAIVLSAPKGSLDFWKSRLEKHGVTVTPQSRLGEQALRFADPDLIPVEIVAAENDPRTPWTGAGIPAEYAIRGLHTGELTVRAAAPTEELLTGPMGFRLLQREGNRARFEAGPGGPGHYADVISAPDAPASPGGVGTIHHIAWDIPTPEAQRAKQSELLNAGFYSSHVLDRDYFLSIYYREHGGILFEIATSGPGFPVDEPVESLGSTLQLPDQFEPHRRQIEKILPALRPAKQYA